MNGCWALQELSGRGADKYECALVNQLLELLEKKLGPSAVIEIEMISETVKPLL